MPLHIEYNLTENISLEGVDQSTTGRWIKEHLGGVKEISVERLTLVVFTTNDGYRELLDHETLQNGGVTDGATAKLLCICCDELFRKARAETRERIAAHQRAVLGGQALSASLKWGMLGFKVALTSKAMSAAPTFYIQIHSALQRMEQNTFRSLANNQTLKGLQAFFERVVPSVKAEVIRAKLQYFGHLLEPIWKFLKVPLQLGCLVAPKALVLFGVVWSAISVCTLLDLLVRWALSMPCGTMASFLQRLSVNTVPAAITTLVSVFVGNPLAAAASIVLLQILMAVLSDSFFEARAELQERELELSLWYARPDGVSEYVGVSQDDTDVIPGLDAFFCPISLNLPPKDKLVMTQCGHVYHKYFLEEAIERNPQCSLCRARLSMHHVAPWVEGRRIVELVAQMRGWELVENPSPVL